MHSELEHVENCTPEDGLVFLPFPKGIKKHTETGPEKATSPGNDSNIYRFSTAVAV